MASAPFADGACCQKPRRPRHHARPNVGLEAHLMQVLANRIPAASPEFTLGQIEPHRFGEAGEHSTLPCHIATCLTGTPWHRASTDECPGIMPVASDASIMPAWCLGTQHHLARDEPQSASCEPRVSVQPPIVSSGAPKGRPGRLRPPEGSQSFFQKVSRSYVEGTLGPPKATYVLGSKIKGSLPSHGHFTPQAQAVPLTTTSSSSILLSLHWGANTYQYSSLTMPTDANVSPFTLERLVSYLLDRTAPEINMVLNRELQRIWEGGEPKQEPSSTEQQMTGHDKQDHSPDVSPNRESRL